MNSGATSTGEKAPITLMNKKLKYSTSIAQLREVIPHDWYSHKYRERLVRQGSEQPLDAKSEKSS